MEVNYNFIYHGFARTPKALLQRFQVLVSLHGDLRHAMAYYQT